MSTVLARLRVLLGAVPTYLAAAGVIVAILADEIGKLAPGGWQDNAVQILGVLAGIIAAATAIVRRVMPVAPNQRGLLVPPPKGDVGAVGLGVLFLVVALVCFAIFALIAHGTFVTDEGLTWLGAGLTSATLAKLVP